MRRTSTIIALVVMLVIVFWSIGRLFALRFEKGDVYPAYSTLRMDPLGAKALADALEAMPGLEVERNYRPLVRLKPAQPITLVYVGVDYQARWEEAELEEFERLVSTGSRAIFAFHRELTRAQRLGSANTPPAATPAPGGTPTPAPSKVGPKKDEHGISFTEVSEKWGFEFSVARDSERKAITGTATPATPEFSETFPWRSALHFQQLAPEWKTLYTCNNLPVIIEREFEKGSIVLASDVFFLSNEGLSDNPPGELLAALFASKKIVFDEEHHGVKESSTIGMLARRMRLHGLALALLAIAGLFVWKQSTSLLPQQDRTRGDYDVAGTAANEGFINLLHRSVRPGSLLETCVTAWLRARGRFVSAEERTHIDAVLRSHGGRSAKDIPAAYRSIAQGLSRK